MGLSWTDRLEDVSAQEWDSVLVRSFRPSPFLSRHFLIPWAKTFAAGHPKRIYRWERNGETCGLLLLCLCESAAGGGLRGGGEGAPPPARPPPSSCGECLLRLGKKERHVLRRKMRRAEETTSGLSYRVTRTREEFDRDFPSFLALHRQSHLDKADFMHERMEGVFREVGEGFLSAQRLRLAFPSGGGGGLASAFQRR